MYCEYWNLNKPPFDNVPDPSMYIDCHVSMENVISETIFAIKEANECFAVIIGDVGLGKTLSLRIIIDSLEPHKYKIALITNPSISFVQLLREIIGQISGKQCEENTKVDLLEIFNHLLFEVIDQGKKIVIFIDEANAISPANLENLRLLTNMQDDKRNLFTLVLAGQMELAQRLEHPKRANLFQRIGTYGRIDKLPSEQSVKTYIETRLKLAGAQRKFFAEDCIPVIWEASDHGIPRLINKICKLCLKAGETNEFRIITPEVATQIAERFQKLSQVALQKRKPRSRPDIELSEEDISMLEEMEDSQEITETIIPHDATPQVPTHSEDLADDARQVAENLKNFSKAVLQKHINGNRPDSELTDEDISKIDEFGDSNKIMETITPQETIPKVLSPSDDLEDSSHAISQQGTKTGLILRKIDVSTISLNKPFETKPDDVSSNEDDKSKDSGEELYDEVQIGSHKIKLTIPNHIIKQAASSDRERANKMAGYLAAQILKNNHQLISSPLIDPVSVWNEIRDVILTKMNVSSTSNSTLEEP